MSNKIEKKPVQVMEERNQCQLKELNFDFLNFESNSNIQRNMKRK